MPGSGSLDLVTQVFITLATKWGLPAVFVKAPFEERHGKWHKWLQALEKQSRADRDPDARMKMTGSSPLTPKTSILPTLRRNILNKEKRPSSINLHYCFSCLPVSASLTEPVCLCFLYVLTACSTRCKAAALRASMTAEPGPLAPAQDVVSVDP